MVVVLGLQGEGSFVDPSFLVFVACLVVRSNQQVVEVDIVEYLDQPPEEVTTTFSVVWVPMRSTRGLTVDKAAEGIELGCKVVVINFGQDHFWVGICTVSVE